MIPIDELSILHRLKKDFFRDDVVRFEMDFEGQKMDGDVFVLGCSVAMTQGVEYLMHEMAHFAELSIERIVKHPKYNWDLSLPKGYLNGRLYYDARTSSSLLREARVWAFQVSMHRHYGFDVGVERLVSSAEYLNAWTIYKVEIGQRDDKKAMKVLAEYVETLSRTEFTFDVFKTSWNERVLALRKN